MGKGILADKFSLWYDCAAPQIRGTIFSYQFSKKEVKEICDEFASEEPYVFEETAMRKQQKGAV